MKLFEEFSLYENLWEDAQQAHDELCDECGKNKHEVKTIFGQYLCRDCDEKYINSAKGKIELFSAIVDGRTDATKLSAAEIKEAADAWSTYHTELPWMYIARKVPKGVR